MSVAPLALHVNLCSLSRYSITGEPIGFRWWSSSLHKNKNSCHGVADTLPTAEHLPQMEKMTFTENPRIAIKRGFTRLQDHSAIMRRKKDLEADV
ncbi:hypothetical protein BHM03_00002522 [Ensete ventricosum]|uniref:Uncharacterized protein n=1 Tax=Ensete ventricosum TaxID=4639 RepID=A0A426ZZ83_ENSVE|nr:hypothetical protein B296_00001820 [Ensete ventricosum]RZR70964.1 hypothetical protein BHM03_00002522 [Ensete ventricosum]